MPTDVKYNKKQMVAMMERYTLDLLRPHLFEDLPVKFKIDVSQYGNSVSCHLRTTEGVLLKVSELVEWFHTLPEKQQAEILDV